MLVEIIAIKMRIRVENIGVVGDDDIRQVFEGADFEIVHREGADIILEVSSEESKDIIFSKDHEFVGDAPILITTVDDDDDDKAVDLVDDDSDESEGKPEEPVKLEDVHIEGAVRASGSLQEAIQQVSLPSRAKLPDSDPFTLFIDSQNLSLILAGILTFLALGVLLS